MGYNLLGDEMFYILTGILVAQQYTFVKIHQIVYLKQVQGSRGLYLSGAAVENQQ